MNNQEKKHNWLDELVDFYDFIWQEGISAHKSCINDELLKDFREGGNKFERMKELIVKKFPTKEEALKAFKSK